jgi:hypothetical protein
MDRVPHLGLRDGVAAQDMRKVWCFYIRGRERTAYPPRSQQGPHFGDISAVDH